MTAFPAVQPFGQDAVKVRSEPVLQDFCAAANAVCQEAVENPQQSLGFRTWFLVDSDEVVCECSKNKRFWRVLSASYKSGHHHFCQGRPASTSSRVYFSTRSGKGRDIRTPLLPDPVSSSSSPNAPTPKFSRYSKSNP